MQFRGRTMKQTRQHIQQLIHQSRRGIMRLTVNLHAEPRSSNLIKHYSGRKTPQLRDSTGFQDIEPVFGEFVQMVRSQRLEQEVEANTPGEHEKSDVQKMKILTELIEKQRRIDKYWNLTWGFTKDYDYYGNYRPNRNNRGVTSLEPRAVPNTSAANYGFYMDSERAINIRNLERGMIRDIRRS
ncbi:hypothetical protein T265_04848 [Opisthorchis viverrini]|uniref:Uncharacterized protein n=1 Tax=Opisthorchis viverrini TaxID=6198 RepID=A0A074ZMJ5_OPIVI|nr:hypothetical protein T265_04848 [Opisthorchis viverrini]KER28321.1 hypothetical protein T265_04848 [Opisthorchis viverrini]